MTMWKWLAGIFSMHQHTQKAPAKNGRLPYSGQSPASSGPLPTVKFDASRVTDDVKEDLLNNLSKINEFLSLGDNSFNELYHIAVKSIERGHDLGSLTSGILETKTDGLTKSRAGEIARSLHNKASAIMTRNSQIQIGIRYAIWLNAKGAPCYNGRSPTKKEIARDKAHKAADGKRYDVAKGMLIEGYRAWPGYDEGCRCIGRSIIPGLPNTPD